MRTSVLIAAMVSTLLGGAMPSEAASGPTGASHRQPTVTEHGGVITIRGTRAAERIKVSGQGRTLAVRVDGKKLRVPTCPTHCRTIQVVALGGDDRVTLQGRRADSLVRIVVFGGKGDDDLRGDGRTAAVDQQSWDVLDGGQGDDLLRSGGGADTMRGGTGSDSYVIDAAYPNVWTITDSDPDDNHLSFAPTTLDTVNVELDRTGAHGWDHFADVTGGSGDDFLSTFLGDGELHGGPGDDRLLAFGGDDVLVGDAGDDTYAVCTDCTSGSVRLIDSQGSNTIRTGMTGADTEFHLDTTAWQEFPSGYRAQLSSVTGFRNIEGWSGDDTLVGNALANRLVGNSGDDVLTGGGGADTFYAAFVGDWESDGYGADTVTDFETGVDTVDLAGELVVKSGLGTTTVTIGYTSEDMGTLTSSSGHLWQADDFS